jgi:hypothetical protein
MMVRHRAAAGGRCWWPDPGGHQCSSTINEGRFDFELKEIESKKYVALYAKLATDTMFES